jgi:phosphopantetheinyl transferase
LTVKTLPFYDLEREPKDKDLMGLEPTTPPTAHTVIDPYEAAGWTGMEKIKTLCPGIVLLEIEHLRSQENALFTPREAARAEELWPRRRRLFIAARVALKSLARQIGLIANDTPDSCIETLGPDRTRPCLADSPLYCSVSHTNRFVVAVEHVHPVGVDIEALSEKALRTWHLFMPGKGDDLLSASGMSPERTATRAWTSKEAAAKAFGLNLSEAIREVEIVRVGEAESDVSCRGKTHSVKHAEGEGHVLSLLICGGF